MSQSLDLDSDLDNLCSLGKCLYLRARGRERRQRECSHPLVHSPRRSQWLVQDWPSQNQELETESRTPLYGAETQSLESLLLPLRVSFHRKLELGTTGGYKTQVFQCGMQANCLPPEPKFLTIKPQAWPATWRYDRPY